MHLESAAVSYLLHHRLRPIAYIRTDVKHYDDAIRVSMLQHSGLDQEFTVKSWIVRRIKPGFIHQEASEAIRKISSRESD